MDIPIEQFVMHTVIIGKLPLIEEALNQIISILFTLQVDMRDRAHILQRPIGNIYLFDLILDFPDIALSISLLELL